MPFIKRFEVQESDVCVEQHNKIEVFVLVLLRLEVKEMVAFEHKPPFFENLTVQTFLVETALALIHIVIEDQF